MSKNGSQPATEIPTRIMSHLKLYEQKIKSSIMNKEQQLTEWFINSALRYNDSYIPRIELLSLAETYVKNNIPNPKYINSLFLEEISVINLIQESQYLIDIGFVLSRHLGLKVKAVDCSDNLLTAAKTRTEELLTNKDSQLQTLFSTTEVESFIIHKRRMQESLYIVDKYERQKMEEQAILIYRYLLKPLFEKKNLTNVYDNMYPIIYWFVIIKDEPEEKQRILMDIAKKIDSFLWIKKSAGSIALIRTFNKILDLLSLKNLQEDSFSPFTLAPLLIKLGTNVPYRDLINNWMATIPDKKIQAKLIQNIFRNSLNSGCTLFCFQIISYFSDYLQRTKDYDALYHLFDSFIRKQYLSIKLSDGYYVRNYLNTLMLYAIGFINRDRLDGETELDRLAINLSEMVCKPRFKYDHCHRQIIKFFRIYENRFQFLSHTCKKLVTQLEQTYRINISIASLHQQVADLMFKEYSADYGQDQIYSLQKSSRYAGLVNLGNTCYMNSFMQCLFMTKKFKTLVAKAQDQGILASNHPIFKSLVQLFGQLSSKTSENKTEVQPRQFKKFIPEPFKSSWEQHDSGQFGRMFLDSIATELKDTKLTEKINRLFTHELIAKIICKGCNTQREKKQKCIDFILQIQENSTDVISVSDLLKRNFQGYELDQNNMIECNKCNGKRPALVCYQPVQFAEHLITTISIFKYDKQGSSKIIKPLNFQFSLNFKNILPKIVTEDEIYDLYSFVLHIGKGVERGHYQCFARNLEQNPMLWYKFDDHYVTEQEINQISDFHFGQNQTPYILFYSSSKKSRKIFTSP